MIRNLILGLASCLALAAFPAQVAAQRSRADSG